MFKEKSEYYCINGCFKYPINMATISDFFDELPQISNIDEIICYDTEPYIFSYEKAMDDEYMIVKVDKSLLSTKTLLRMDFCYYGLSCRMQMEPLDDTCYAISLMHNCDDKINEEIYRYLIKIFYHTLKPIYGNDGIEKNVLSIKMIGKRDYNLFDNNFYISETIFNKMSSNYSSIEGPIVLEEGGIYYPKQDIRTTKSLFYAFLKVIDKINIYGRGKNVFKS